MDRAAEKGLDLVQEVAGGYADDPNAVGYQRRLDNTISIINQFGKSVPARSEDSKVLGEEYGDYRPKVIGTALPGAYEARQELEELKREALKLKAGAKNQRDFETAETIEETFQRIEEAEKKYQKALSTTLSEDRTRLESGEAELAIDYALRVADGEAKEYLENNKADMPENHEEFKQDLNETLREIE
jgi:hypothetical protein